MRDVPVIEVNDGGIYNTREPWRIFLNQEEILTTDKVITSLYELKPDTQYHLMVENAAGERFMAYFSTSKEYVTLNVRDFGAKGTGWRTTPILSRQPLWPALKTAGC